jgi:hypothetical protein
VNRLRVLAGAWLLEAAVLLQRDRRDGDAARHRPLRPDWAVAFFRLAVVILTLQLALATCTLGKFA